MFVVGVLEPLFNLFDLIFEPLLGYPALTILVSSVVITLLTTLIYHRMVDLERMKNIREELSNLQKEIRAAKSGDKKSLKKLQMKQRRMMELQGIMMRESFKPMLVYMVPLMIFFYWIRSHYMETWAFARSVPEFVADWSVLSFSSVTGPVMFLSKTMEIVKLPFTFPNWVPLVGGQDYLGYLGWYMLCFTAFSMVWRKLFGIK